MDKKDIYEHLAKIYLDASSRKKKKSKVYSEFIKNIYFISIILILGVGVIAFNTFQKDNSADSEVALVLLTDAAKINFHFDPAKKETFSINLNRMDISRFKQLGFSLRNTKYINNMALRVEFVSAFKEKSEVYLENVPNRWQDYKISLAEFKNISDWSNITNLIFTIEEWNAKEKKGVVLIDNVRLLR